MDGDWALIKLAYPLKKANSTLKITKAHPKLKGKQIEIDELLIIPNGKQIYRKNEREVWKGIRRFEQLELIDSMNIKIQ